MVVVVVVARKIYNFSWTAIVLEGAKNKTLIIEIKSKNIGTYCLVHAIKCWCYCFSFDLSVLFFIFSTPKLWPILFFPFLITQNLPFCCLRDSISSLTSINLVVGVIRDWLILGKLASVIFLNLSFICNDEIYKNKLSFIKLNIVYGNSPLSC